MADDVKSYSYTYTEPGTYTVTFLAGNGNYQGESGIQTYEMKVTIVDRSNKRIMKSESLLFYRRKSRLFSRIQVAILHNFQYL